MFSFRKTNYTAAPGTLDIDVPQPPAPEIRAPLEEHRDLTKRVLLLDDLADYRDVVQEYLASCFFNVTAVSNGAEGLRAFLKDPFDLVVCDMMMPKLNGEMFYWAVIRMRPAAAQRFIFLTGHQSQPAIQAFFRRVNAVTLIKPFPLEALRSIMHETVGKLR